MPLVNNSLTLQMAILQIHFYFLLTKCEKITVLFEGLMTVNKVLDNLAQLFDQYIQHFISSTCLDLPTFRSQATKLPKKFNVFNVFH